MEACGLKYLLFNHEKDPIHYPSVFVFHQCATLSAQTIPLPEHPRPDFERTQWLNLNGVWQFEFDSLDQGVPKNWHEGNVPSRIK